MYESGHIEVPELRQALRRLEALVAEHRESLRSAADRRVADPLLAGLQANLEMLEEEILRVRALLAA